MRLPRMTMRRWMIVVVMSGVVLWIARAAMRSHSYRKRAEYHATALANLNRLLVPALEYRRYQGYFPGCGLMQSGFEDACKETERHASLKTKYEHAARHPWLTVEPD